MGLRLSVTEGRGFSFTTARAATPENATGEKAHDMTPQARQQFLQIALALADQAP
ncbi:MAG: hypothetical protein ACLQVL_18945 [Terriglobia bacterium]